MKRAAAVNQRLKAECRRNDGIGHGGTISKAAYVFNGGDETQ